MIRFIDLGKQIAADESDTAWPRQFAFFDTADCTFLYLNGRQVWDSWQDFTSAWSEHFKPDAARARYDPGTVRQEQGCVDREYRLLQALVPDWVLPAIEIDFTLPGAAALWRTHYARGDKVTSLISIDMTTAEGLQRWEKAHPLSRFVRDGKCVIESCSEAQRLIKEQADALVIKDEAGA